MTRWSLAIAASLAMFVGAWYTCERLARLDSAASWAIAGVAFAAALAVLSWWAAREPAPAAQTQETASAIPAVAGAGDRNQAVTENNAGVIVSGDLNNSTIQIKPARTASRRPAHRPPSLLPTAPSIATDELPALELGLRVRLMITGPSDRSHHIGPGTRSAALDILNDNDHSFTGGVTALEALMDAWCNDSWRAQEWQLHGQASAREANARWRGRDPAGQRLTEARLNLNLAQDQAHGDSLTITVHNLFTNPFRPSLTESLESLFKEWGENPGIPPRRTPRPTAPNPGPFINLFPLHLLILTIFGTLWGPLGDELSTRIFSQPLAPPAQLDVAVFTIGAQSHLFPSRNGINTCIEFAPARLIDGAAPRACTLLDPIEPDLPLLDCDKAEKIVYNWLTQLCLDNGYEHFEEELARISQFSNNP